MSEIQLKPYLSFRSGRWLLISVTKIVMETVLDNGVSVESVTVKLSLKMTSFLMQLESDSSSNAFFNTKLNSSVPSGPSGTS